jgi:hypothetical protein
MPPVGTYTFEENTIRSALLSRVKNRGNSCTGQANPNAKYEIAFDTRIDYPPSEKIEGIFIIENLLEVSNYTRLGKKTSKKSVQRPIIS